MPGSVDGAKSIQAVVRLITAMLLLLGMRAPVSDHPMRLDDQITDRVDALGSRRVEVSSALDVLRSRTGLRLFVVYVRSFDRVPAGKWAYDTARTSDLGRDDGLLAVATGDRAYAYSFDSEFRLDTDQLAQVARIAVEAPLASSDWAGAAIGAAEGYGAALAGQPIPPPTIQPGDPNPGGGPGIAGYVVAGPCLLLGLVLTASGVWLVARLREPRSEAPARGGSAGPISRP